MSRRIIRDKMQRMTDATPRPFNAVVYDIPSAEYCRVLVAGSVNPVRAWFTRSTQHYPSAVKIGNAVMCQYKIGNRGYIEVIGHGTVIPATVAGAPKITIATGNDAIMTGCQVVALPETT